MTNIINNLRYKYIYNIFLPLYMEVPSRIFYNIIFHKQKVWKWTVPICSAPITIRLPTPLYLM